MVKCYLLSTEHLEKMLWFRNEDDFKVGMNHVAIAAAHFPSVSVLSFILMSNHVHFVLKGKIEQVLAFLNQFKRTYSMYMRKKYGVKKFLRNNKVDVKELTYKDEGREKAIAYVQMNSVAANICSHSSQYPWGSGNLFFNASPPAGKRVGDFSKRALANLLHSDFQDLPKDWLIGEDGYVLPASYVDIKAVEVLFRTPNRLNYFCNNSSKARKRIESSDGNLPSFRDQVILPAVGELCRTLYQKRSFNELNQEEQTEILRQLRFRFSADVNQLARVCGLSYAEAARLLDSE